MTCINWVRVRKGARRIVLRGGILTWVKRDQIKMASGEWCDARATSANKTKTRKGKAVIFEFFKIYPWARLEMNIDKPWSSFFRYLTHDQLVGFIFLVDCPSEEAGLWLHLTTKKRQVLTCVTVANLSTLHDLRSRRQTSNFSFLFLPSTPTSKIGISIPTGEGGGARFR